MNLNITSISMNAPKSYRYIKNVNYKICDISDKKKLSNIIKKKFDYVVNLGGYIDHNHNHKIKIYKEHYLGVKNLFYVFKKKKIKSFIQIGSSTEYGFSSSPHKEKNFCKPNGVYGKCKLMATKFLLKAYKKYDFPVTILRLYQIYGPKQNIDRFIPLIIHASLKKIDLPTSHLKQKRDFLFVDDAVNAIIKAINCNTSIGKIINIGSGKPIILKKIVKYVQKKIKGGKFLFGKIQLRSDEPIIIYPDLKYAKKFLKWYPKVNFSKGLNKTILFYKNTSF